MEKFCKRLGLELNILIFFCVVSDVHCMCCLGMCCLDVVADDSMFNLCLVWCHSVFTAIYVSEQIIKYIVDKNEILF